MSEIFHASRWTSGNRLWRTTLEVTDHAIIRRKRSWFTVNEMSIHLSRVASVRIDTGMLWADILVESTGGSDPLTSHGHTKQDARRIKELIESFQSRHSG
ncbi:MAG TPA: PH domain-containing protein [Holophagaceae bacterium]|nr:PH domain-containing protein [Holophagaceae bacterium]